MPGRILAVLATALVGVLWLVAPAGTATAAQGGPDRAPGVLHAFNLKGSNGYEGYVLAGGDSKSIATGATPTYWR